jgi:hypothetical protein
MKKADPLLKPNLKPFKLGMDKLGETGKKTKNIPSKRSTTGINYDAT